MNILAQILVEKQCLRHLQIVEVLQNRLQLVLEYLVELLPQVVAAVDFCELFHAVDEELQLFENLPKDLNILVVDRLVQQVVEAESASNDQHEALVQLASDVEEQLVVVLQLEAVVLDVVDHPRLLLVEELPDLENILEMVAGNFVEVTFLQTQLLLILLFQHLEVEIEEAHYLGGVLGLQAVDVVEEVVEG